MRQKKNLDELAKYLTDLFLAFLRQMEFKKQTNSVIYIERKPVLADPWKTFYDQTRQKIGFPQFLKPSWPMSIVAIAHIIIYIICAMFHHLHIICIENAVSTSNETACTFSWVILRIDVWKHHDCIMP